MPPIIMEKTHRVHGTPVDGFSKYDSSKYPDGSWLCSEGPYQDYIMKLCDANPALKQADPENSAAPLSQRDVQATVLAVDEKNNYHHVFTMESSQYLHLLDEMLKSRQGMRNVWIIENINRDMVALLGKHFKMDPDFFVGYERSSTWRRWANEPNLSPRLPSIAGSTRYFTIKYCDLRDFGPEIDSYSVSCAETGRYLHRTKWNEYWVSPSSVDRNCSGWYRHINKDEWDGTSKSTLFIYCSGHTHSEQ